MAQSFPYTYYSCPCVDTSTSGPTSLSAKRSSQTQVAAKDDEDEDRTFDPQSPRANYSLYPLEHLLYCEDCHQIRCPRCVADEVICWFCPSCLFEVPWSQVKSEGNRCSRNCYNCPICTAPMIVSSLEPPSNKHLAPDDLATAQMGGPYFMQCTYCQWSTLDIGIEFEKPGNITGQLARLKNGGGTMRPLKEREKERDRRKEYSEKGGGKTSKPEPHSSEPLSHEEAFSNLNAFYKQQISDVTVGSGFNPHDINFNSPSSLTRIMSIYSSGGAAKKAARNRPKTMREASNRDEGLALHDSSQDATTIDRMKSLGWDCTTTPSQRAAQLDPNAHFLSNVRPIAPLLRTKRAKRCRTCRHILAKPETKLSSTRYKIKLLALNNVPRLAIRPLAAQPSALPSSPFSGPLLPPLKPGITANYILTLHNPLFDPVRVTLATPHVTPGRVRSKVTILCPEFDIGANTDVWDEALGSSASGDPRNRRKGPTSSSTSGSVGGSLQAVEAGKVWEKGRNWTSVVVEVVPGLLDGCAPFTGSFDGSFGMAGAHLDEESGLDEDEDVLEIPIFVRIEYETEAATEEKSGHGFALASAGKESKAEGREGEKVRREEAFWCVLGIGRIEG